MLLLGIVSGQRAAYAEVCDGVTTQDLERDELEYRRARDKGDKSLELYKFYVNALYVAMTRAVESLTIVESDTGHPLLGLLGLKLGEARAAAGAGIHQGRMGAGSAQARAAGQGRAGPRHPRRLPASQAGALDAVESPLIEDLAPKALDRSNPSAKPKQALLDYALWHGQQAWVEQLARANFQPARSLAPEGRLRLDRRIGDAGRAAARLEAAAGTVAAHGGRIAAAPPAGLQREELQGHSATVRRSMASTT